MVLRRTMRANRGMTLVELLVVVAIVVLLIAVLLPMMRPAMENSKLRETARQVNAYFTMAQSLAAARGRPVGVRIERQPDPTGSTALAGSFRLSLVETPMPYAGSTTDDRATIDVASGSNTGKATLLGGPPSWVGQGDRIRFNYGGAFYYIVGAPSSSTISFKTTPFGAPNDPYAVLPAPSAKDNATGRLQGVPFQIYRRPVKSSVAPLELTPPTLIDLSASGYLLAGDQFATTSGPIIITFSPGGRLDFLYIDDTPIRPDGPVFLLVGRQDQLPGTVRADVTKPDNWADPSSIWVVINHRSGLVTSAANFAASNLAESRRFALEGQNMGEQ